MDRALCPVLIGREEEIGRLEDALLQANRGSGQVVLVAGDAGMGKTRLATEIERRARTLGMEVIVGGCSEAEMALPYLPFIEAVGNFLATQDLDEIRGGLGPVRRELAHLFPQLEPDTLTPDVDSAQGRLRLFEAILGLLAIPARRQGLLVVVEDLHWSDASTRELLDFLTRRLRNSRILVVGTYRRDEMHRRHPLVSMIQAWRRSNSATLVELEPLTPERVAAMVRAIFDLQEVQDDTRDFLHARSEGNPFVLEELLKAALDRGDIFRDGEGWTRKALAEIRIPESVRDTILLRLDKLSPEQVEVLRSAAVLGSSFSYAALVELSGLAEDGVGAAVETCVQQQLLQDDPSRVGRFRFRHALTREAIYEDMIAPHRERLHSRAADLLARGAAAPVEITFHLLAGGRAVEAVPLCLQAASDAEAAYAHRDAMVLYLRALPHVTGGGERADLLCRLGVAAQRAGEVARARAYLEEGIAGLAVPDSIEAARYRLSLGRCLWESNRADLALAEYTGARAVLEAAGPSSDLAIAYVRLAGLRLFNFDNSACVELATRARDVAEKAGDRGVAIWANSFIGSALAGMGRADEAIALIDQSYEEARAAGFPIWAENALYNGCVMRFANWRQSEVAERIRLAADLINSPSVEGNWLTIEASLMGAQGRAAVSLERYRRAEEAYREAGSDLAMLRARSSAASTLLELDRIGEALELMPSPEVFQEPQERMWQIVFQLRMAEAQGDDSASRAAAARISEVGGWIANARRVVGIRVVDTCIRLNDLAGAEEAVRIIGDLGPDSEAPRDFIQGRLASGRGEHRTAAELLSKAADFYSEAGYVIVDWLSRVRLAESLAALDEAEAARVQLERVIAEATERGNPLTIRLARQTLEHLGLGSPAAPPTTPEPASPTAPAVPTGERLVTVLFADVRGYTALSRSAEPADTVDRIGALQRWAKVEIERHHGLVDKFAGDAVMATFNVSGATVDHAVHAFETALAIRDKAAALGLPVGIGIATGAAIVGALAPGANLSVVGETTNLASRLQGQAEAGEVMISEAVRRRLAGWLDAHPTEIVTANLRLKGFDDEVLAYRLR